MQTEQLSKNPKCEIIHTVGNTKTRIRNKQLYTLGNLIERIAKGTVTVEDPKWTIIHTVGNSRREPEAHCGNQTVEQTDCGNKTSREWCTVHILYSIHMWLRFNLQYIFVSNI